MRSLAGQEQWENFATHHWGRWSGLLIRYDGSGQVLDVLNSVRSFIPSPDRLSVTHSLEFTSRRTGEATHKQWQLVPGHPLVIHPVDPSALLFFNHTTPDLMVGQQRTGQSFYFEPYLSNGDRRTSLVVMYRHNSPQPQSLSFFREIKEGAANPWWTETSTVKLAQTSSPAIPSVSTHLSCVSLKELAQLSIPCSLTFEGEFLQYEFPDAVNLLVSADRFQTPYSATVWWTAQADVTQICSLRYTATGHEGEVAIFGH